MSPKLVTVEVAIGTDSDERTGVGARGGVGASQGRKPGPGGCGHADGRELPPGEAALAVIQTRRGESPPPPPGGAGLQSRDVDQDAAAGVGAHPAEIQRRRADSLWADADGGASGE